MWSLFRSSETQRERQRIDALVKATARKNYLILLRNYKMQSDFSRVCRQRKISCFDAASTLFDDARQHSADQVATQKVSHALYRLDIAVANLTGGRRRADDIAVDLLAMIADLRVMIANAETVEVDSAAHLADLDRIAGSVNEEDPGTRALAAHEAVAVRKAKETPALELALAEARKALEDGSCPKLEEPFDVESIREHLDKAFEMGYVGSLWRGIEHLLPEDVAECRGKMPYPIEKVAKKIYWYS